MSQHPCFVFEYLMYKALCIIYSVYIEVILKYNLVCLQQLIHYQGLINCSHPSVYLGKWPQCLWWLCFLNAADVRGDCWHTHIDVHTFVQKKIPCLWVYASSLVALSIIKACPTQQAHTHTHTEQECSENWLSSNTSVRHHLSFSLTVSYLFKLSPASPPPGTCFLFFKAGFLL